MPLSRIVLMVFALAWSLTGYGQPTEAQVKQQWQAYYELSKKMNKLDEKLMQKERASKNLKEMEQPRKAENFGFPKEGWPTEFLKLMKVNVLPILSSASKPLPGGGQKP